MVVVTGSFENLELFNNFMKKCGDKLVVIDFTATWCGPCQKMKPLFKAMCETYEPKGVVFVAIDVDENEEVCGTLGISAMPTFQFWKNGSKVQEFVGADANRLEAMLKEQL